MRTGKKSFRSLFQKGTAAFKPHDAAAIAIVLGATAGLIAFRLTLIEPRAWGSACAGAAAPLACLPRDGMIWLQRYYLLGWSSLALGLWSFAARAPFWVAIAAIVTGVAAIENYNATYGAVGAALGCWAWLGQERARA